MGRISDEDIQRVRDATDVVALISESVVLKQKGRLHWGCCPFHDEKTPSFKVDPGTQLWHCFGCGAGGDAFGFLMRQENMEFPDAVRFLADRAHVEITETGESVSRGHKERLYAACEEAVAFYHKALLFSRDDGAASAREYLKRRGFGIEVSKRFELGYSPGHGALVRHLQSSGFTAEEMVEANLAYPAEGGAQPRDRFFGRVMFPIRDLSGRAVGFGGRVLGQGEPKYLNTQETPIFHKSQNLYAIDRAKNEIVKADGTAVVVEGYTDVIALHEAGFGNVVATLGTALTRGHLKLLARFAKRVVYLFDGDAAGQRAAERAGEFVHASLEGTGSAELALTVAVVPEAMDPADFVAEHGADPLRKVVDEATPLMRFVLDSRLARHDLESPEGRVRALADVARVLAALQGWLLAQDYTNYVADRLLTDYATVQQAVAQARPEFGDSAAAGSAGDVESQRFDGPLTPAMRAERTLVGMVAASPALRPKAQKLLESDLLVDSVARRVLKLTLDARSATGGELFAAVSSADGRLGEVLTGMLVEVEETREPEELVKELLSKLKEFALERQIITRKARMKALDPVKNGVEYDDLFREIASLQIELEQVRAREGEDDRFKEVWG